VVAPGPRYALSSAAQTKGCTLSAHRTAQHPTAANSSGRIERCLSADCLVRVEAFRAMPWFPGTRDSVPPIADNE
jgi:hypothetical protein